RYSILPGRALPRQLTALPTRRSSDLRGRAHALLLQDQQAHLQLGDGGPAARAVAAPDAGPLGPLPLSAPAQRGRALQHTLHRRRSEEHTSELQSRFDLVCRLLLDKKN